MTTAGFTGTREGMTDAQQLRINWLLGELGMPGEARHGVCQGSDEQFHFLVRKIAPDAKITGHPGVDREGRSRWRSRRSEADCDVLMPELFYLVRDEMIVRASDFMIAIPRGFVEQRRGSGTWATIRIARKVGIDTYVIMPDGMIEEYRAGGLTVY